MRRPCSQTCNPINSLLSALLPVKECQFSHSVGHESSRNVTLKETAAWFSAVSLSCISSQARQISSRATTNEEAGSGWEEVWVRGEGTGEGTRFPPYGKIKPLWICLGAHRCSLRGQFTRVKPGIHKLCRTQQHCILLQSLNSLLYNVTAWF